MNIRPADTADLAGIYAVWYATEVAGVAEPPPPRAMPWFSHLLEIGRLVVATEADAVIGFAGALHHGRCVALSDLFVHPRAQSAGVGRALLDAAVPPGSAAVTMASSDARALAAYARRGMAPRWPAFYMAAPAHEIRRIEAGPGGDLVVSALATEDYAWQLPGDDAHYRGLGARCLAVEREGVRVGTALTVERSPQRLFHPDTTEVLESSVDDAADAAAVLLAVVRLLVEEGARRVMAQVPGPHAGLPALLTLGFRIVDTDIACATASELLADPSRHTMHGESRVAAWPR